MIDGEFRGVYRAKVDPYILYALKQGIAWRWGIAMHGTTIIDGIAGTLIDAKHKAESEYGPTRGPRQLTVSEATHDDGTDAPF